MAERRQHGFDVRLDTTDVELASRVLAHEYAPHTLTVRGDPDRFHSYLRVASEGAAGVDVQRHAVACEMRSTAPLERMHCVLLPVSGALSVTSGAVSQTVAPRDSVVLDADAEFGLRWPRGSAVTCVRLDRSAVDAVAARALGDIRAVRFRLGSPRSQPDAQVWRSGLQLLTASLHHPALRDAGPLWRAELHRHVIEVLLRTHPLETLRGPPEPDAWSSTARAVDYLYDHAGEPYDACAVARAARTSVRSMQQAFRRELGTSPLQHLIRIRLLKARDELRRGDPSMVTVADVATAWGFGNLGRFSRRFREEFGVLPSEVLRGTPDVRG